MISNATEDNNTLVAQIELLKEEHKHNMDQLMKNFLKQTEEQQGQIQAQSNPCAAILKEKLWKKWREGYEKEKKACEERLAARGVKVDIGPVDGDAPPQADHTHQNAITKATPLSRPTTPAISMTAALKDVGLAQSNPRAAILKEKLWKKWREGYEKEKKACEERLAARGVKVDIGPVDGDAPPQADHTPQDAITKATPLSRPTTPAISMTAALKDVGVVLNAEMKDQKIAHEKTLAEIIEKHAEKLKEKEGKHRERMYKELQNDTLKNIQPAGDSPKHIQTKVHSQKGAATQQVSNVNTRSSLKHQPNETAVESPKKISWKLPPVNSRNIR